MTVRIKKLDSGAVIPSYASAGAAGADLYACMAEPIVIGAGETALIHTGLAMEIPAGYVGLVFARSGLALKRSLAPANKVGVIDSDYRGEVMVALHNHGASDATVEPGERVAQLVLMPCPQALFEEARELEDTSRGAGGFGSTGRK